MMRLSTDIDVRGRIVTVREFDAETVYKLLKWQEDHPGLRAHELLPHQRELIELIGDAVEAKDGQPLDVERLGFGAVMQIVDALQAVNQSFLALLVQTGRLPAAGRDSPSPSN